MACEPFDLWTEEGVGIAGLHVARRPSDTVIVYAHGMLANKRHIMRATRFVEAITSDVALMAIDLRGHGESGGGCTMGWREAHDIEAVVRYARSLGYRRVVTAGSSTGEATVIRHAALYGSQDGVVMMGAFADCDDTGHLMTDYGLRFLYRTGWLGRAWSYLLYGTRLGRVEAHDSPESLVHRIAPTPCC